GLLMPSRVTMLQRIDQLAQSRAEASQAQANELRRLERDIHDGPQQRLIRVGMDLAAAQRRLEAGDQAAADQLIAQARQMSEEAVNELRALSRGIAPPILADRGLAVALEAALAASPVPATMQLDLPTGARLPAAIETVLYYTVTEALANAAKHSGASQVTVNLEVTGGQARLEVGDDGSGGAQVQPGHGLANLAARASAVDGSLTVDSVSGQGTRIKVEVPLANESGVG
ncbi:MAG: sensor histidine kinase, partial [Micrococcales bacterium]|nr:sensor histidine kinase [Micrococcales bacterium]